MGAAVADLVNSSPIFDSRWTELNRGIANVAPLHVEFALNRLAFVSKLATPAGVTDALVYARTYFPAHAASHTQGTASAVPPFLLLRTPPWRVRMHMRVPVCACVCLCVCLCVCCVCLCVL